jgi:hypothetical protein
MREGEKPIDEGKAYRSGIVNVTALAWEKKQAQCR